ncbi:hypothetical protein GCM10023214_11570 [Amycolatopsis dongchuanensis]|uniref:Uncharacterized protein n=1 Tax=Amycolatopsis dongchuanensis TaxID=1070866 RepID=A0ABP9Q1K3_9PSEU
MRLATGYRRWAGRGSQRRPGEAWLAEAGSQPQPSTLGYHCHRGRGFGGAEARHTAAQAGATPALGYSRASRRRRDEARRPAAPALGYRPRAGEGLGGAEVRRAVPEPPHPP